jgi:thiosulfate/3-mercaptopyruvate sulfurtransferase
MTHAFVLAVTLLVSERMLVSTEWLAQNLRDVTVVHVGTPQAFAEDHVPGAHFLDVAKLVETRTGDRDELPRIDQLQKTIEELGIGTRGRVVIYGDEPQFASRLFFTLDYLGQGKRLSLLDGGLAKWKRDLRPVASGAPDHKPRPFTARIELERLMLLTALQKLKDVPIVDVRAPAAFEAGHIPNAVNVFWKSTLTDAGTLRRPDELRALFPVAPAAHVVVYDDTGMLASWSYFVLRYLNLAPALYDGGFEQWKERVVAKPEG